MAQSLSSVRMSAQAATSHDSYYHHESEQFSNTLPDSLLTLTDHSLQTCTKKCNTLLRSFRQDAPKQPRAYSHLVVLRLSDLRARTQCRAVIYSARLNLYRLNNQRFKSVIGKKSFFFNSLSNYLRYQRASRYFSRKLMLVQSHALDRSFQGLCLCPCKRRRPRKGRCDDLLL